MTIHLTQQQAAATLEALQDKLSNMEGVFHRLQRFNPDSLRIPKIAVELTILRLAVSAFEMAMAGNQQD